MHRIKKKHPLAIRWFHWINFPLLMLMIWSGILIYWANDAYGIRLDGATLFHFFPAPFYAKFHLDARLAEGMAWHFLFMWFFTINGLLYVLYTAFAGEWRFLVPNRHSLGEAFQVVLHDLHMCKEPLPPRKFNGAQQIAYTSIIVMGAGSVLTGLAIYKPIQFAWLTAFLNGNLLGVSGYTAARFLHFWLMVGYVLFFVIHVVQVARAGWNNFRAMVTGYELVPVEPDKSDKQAQLPPSRPNQDALPKIGHTATDSPTPGAARPI